MQNFGSEDNGKENYVLIARKIIAQNLVSFLHFIPFYLQLYTFLYIYV